MHASDQRNFFWLSLGDQALMKRLVAADAAVVVAVDTGSGTSAALLRSTGLRAGALA